MLRCEGLQHHYAGFTLGPVDVTIDRGRLAVLVGPNASGKTTLLNLLAGLKSPSMGSICLDGVNLSNTGRRERAGKLVALPQRPWAGEGMTVIELVRLGRLQLGRDDEAIESALDQMGLLTHQSTPLGALSIGQRQRAHFARVLAQAEPKSMLVLDEPTAPLDPVWAQRAWAVLREHVASGGGAVLAVHDIAIASAMADDAWMLHEGQVRCSGVASKVLAPDALCEAFGQRYEWAIRSDGSRWLVPAPCSETSDAHLKRPGQSSE